MSDLALDPASAAVASSLPRRGAAGGNTPGVQAAVADPNVNGLFSGAKWANLTVTYSFPTLGTQYVDGYGPEPTTNFAPASATLQTATRAVFDLISQYANLVFTQVNPATTKADIAAAISTANNNDTAYAYGPGNDANSGDIWFGTAVPALQNPVKGQYSWTTVMHELGHTLGLKHGHEVEGAFPTMQPAFDQISYSIMSYRSYVGASATAGYTLEDDGFAQTYMMYDIAALQAMYGANFTTNAGDTVYRWSATTGEMFINNVGQGAPSANRIFLTIWDGNGVDTYDFSNYTTSLNINLAPGAFSKTGDLQLSNLGNGNFAPGEIFNALQFNGDARSLIENAIGGSGADTLAGNSADNRLTGGAGADILIGGAGSDTAVYAEKAQSVVVFLNGGTAAAVQVGGANEDTVREIENLIGGAGGDSLVGDGSVNRLSGGGDNDFLFAHGFNPDGTLKTGAGSDTLNGDAGNDGLFGGDGVDTLNGGDGNDGMAAGGGNDTVNGGAGTDFLFGGAFSPAGARPDGSGADTLNGGADKDGLYGFDGDDILNGDAGDDYIEGGAGADTLNGGAGSDFLLGQDGNDTINGGAGFDYMFGAAGADTFVFKKGDSADWVLDFSAAQGDKVSFQNLGSRILALFPLSISRPPAIPPCSSPSSKAETSISSPSSARRWRSSMPRTCSSPEYVRQRTSRAMILTIGPFR